MRAFIHSAIPRKALLVIALALVTPALGGCGEINGMLDAGAGKGKDEKKSAAASSSGQSAKEKLDAYYNREPREVEQDPNDPIVPCRLSGRTQYMRKNDCMLRGGSSA